MTRKPIGKRLRFELFKRDGFRCRYCGATPDQCVLHVDHVVAVANGGTDDPSNLVTACDGCNLGKSSRPLGQCFVPASDPEALREQLEQIREYATLQQEMREARAAITQQFRGMWITKIGDLSEDMCQRLDGVVARERHEDIAEAIDATAKKFAYNDYDWELALRSQKYFSGVLRMIRKRREEGANGD